MKMAFLLCVLAAGLLAASPAVAAGPTVSFAPAPLEIPAGQTVPLVVNIADIQGLYGFEMLLKFDPAVVEVVDADPAREGTQLLPGDFLALDLLVRNTADNAAGTAEYVLTQINPSEAKSGSGKLLTLYLKGKAAGASSNVEIVKAQFANRNGERIEVTLANGQARVAAAAPPVSSPTPLPTAAAPQIELPAATEESVAAAPSATLASSATPAPATAAPAATATPAAPVVAAEATGTGVDPTATATAAPAGIEADVPADTAAVPAAAEPAAAEPATATPAPAAVAQAPAQKAAGGSQPRVVPEAPASATAAAVQPARNSVLLVAGGGLLALAAAGVVALLLLRRRL